MRRRTLTQSIAAVVLLAFTYTSHSQQRRGVIQDLELPHPSSPSLVITTLNWADTDPHQGERMEAWVNDAGLSGGTTYSGKDFGMLAVNELHYRKDRGFYQPELMNCPDQDTAILAITCLTTLLNTRYSLGSDRYTSDLYSENGIVYDTRAVQLRDNLITYRLPRGTFLGFESFFGAGKSAQRAIVGRRVALARSGHTFQFYSTHLSTHECSNCRVHGAKRIVEIARENYVRGDLPPIVAGDFNDRDPATDGESREVQRVMGEYFVDAGAAFGHSIIDHIWIGRPERFHGARMAWTVEGAQVDAKIRDSPALLSNGVTARLSDHYSLTAQLRHTRLPTAVNSVAAGQQIGPALGMDRNGNYVVVWEDDQDENRAWQILARGFTQTQVARFTLEEPTPVNSVPHGQQVNPAVAMAADGTFVIVWQDDQDENGKWEILARGFWQFGSPRFSIEEPAQVNSVSTGQQINPAVGIDNAGNFVVVFQDDRDQNGLYEIVAQGFDSGGNRRLSLEGSRRVNSVSKGNQINPTIAMNASGDFVIVWQDDQDENGKWELLARGFDATGAARFSIEAPSQVNSVSAGQQIYPAVAMDAAGNFVVVWQDDQDENGVYQILARGFDASGRSKFNLEEPTAVNTISTGQQVRPAVAMAPNGRFVIVWQDDQDENQVYEIHARGFNADGTPRYSREAGRPVNVAARGQQRAPTVAIMPNGITAVAWEDDGDENGTFEILSASISSSGNSF